ncbi:MAG: leucine-rich repeat domain-containing protein [Eubacterium sp.]
MTKKVFCGLCTVMLLALTGCSGEDGQKEVKQITPEPIVTSVPKQGGNAKEDTIHMDKSGYLPFVSSETATKLAIADGVELQDYERVVDARVVGEGETFAYITPRYNSWFVGVPQVTKVSLGKKGVSLESASKVYTDGGLVMYKGKSKGVFACPIPAEGRIEVPQGTKDIYDCAFYGCQKITSVALPESVRWIGGAAFGEASRLESIEVSMNNPFLKSEDGVLYTKDGLVLLAYPAGKPDKYYKVKDGVKFIAGGAFAGADNLEEIELPRGVFSVEEYAFKGCRHLNKISGASRIYSVKETAYEYCEELDTIDRPLMDGELANGLMPIWEENYMKNELSYVFDALPWKFSRANQGYITREDITRVLKLSGLKVPKRLKKKIDKVTYSYEMQILTDLAQNSVSWVDFDTKMDNFLQRYGR